MVKTGIPPTPAPHPDTVVDVDAVADLLLQPKPKVVKLTDVPDLRPDEHTDR